MFCYIFVFSLVINFINPQNRIEFKVTESTYALYMSSDAYINNIAKLLPEKQSSANTPYGFYIGNLEKANTSPLLAGILTIVIKKDENEEKIFSACAVVDLTQNRQGMALFCENQKEYDSIEFAPRDFDNIRIEGIESIKFVSSVIEGKNTETNGDSLNNCNGKYMVLILALLLFI